LALDRGQKIASPMQTKVAKALVCVGQQQPILEGSAIARASSTAACAQSPAAMPSFDPASQRTSGLFG
jgi:hypothetical protein